VGPKIAQVAYVSTRAACVMADVNSHISASTGPISRTFGKNHHRYVHGHRTKEVIAMRKLLSERYAWENAYYFT
tara:strand:+ start:2772 stop:2993 length:222 start_codon:yes stop_codon:yes gene_type:complete